MQARTPSRRSNETTLVGAHAVAVGFIGLAMSASPAFGDGEPIFWGSNLSSQCTPPAWLGSVRQIAGGRIHSLALRPDGSVVAWGGNSSGQATVPIGLGRAIEIAAGENHSAAVLADGTVRCWGSNSSGASTVPPGLPPVRSVTAGGNSTFVISRENVVRQWGHINALAPVPQGLAPTARVSAGQLHCMAMGFDGSLRCWGFDEWGAVTPPASLTTVRAIAAGALHAAALTTDQRVVCWGRSDNGQTAVPAGLSDVVAIAAGGAHTAALRDDGSIVCWGYDASGQATPPKQPPTRQLAVGFEHSMAIPCGASVELRSSQNLGAFGFGVVKSFAFTDLPPTANGAVTLEVVARGDLDLASEFLVVSVDGATPGTVLFATAGSAADCPTEPNRAVIQIPTASYAALAADSVISITVESSVGVSAAQCASGSIVLELTVPGYLVDCNGNGFDDGCDLRTGSDIFDCDANGSIDSCDIAVNPALDCDGSGILDWCEIASGAQDKDADGRLDSCEFAVGDLDLNGAITGADLAGILGVWGVPNAPYGDLDGDGIVGGGDLAILLNRWGILH